MTIRWLPGSMTTFFPREDRLDARCVKAATLLGIAECLRFGITSVSDMYNFTETVAEARRRVWHQGQSGRGTTLFDDTDFSFDTYPACQELDAARKHWDGFDNGRIRIEASVHAEYTSTYPLWDALGEYAYNNHIGMHVHLSETKDEHEQCKERYGLTPAQILDCHHVWDSRAIAAHCVWLEPEDMKLLAKRGVSAVHWSCQQPEARQRHCQCDGNGQIGHECSPRHRWGCLQQQS